MSADSATAGKDALSGASIHERWEEVYRNPLSETIYDAAFAWIAHNVGMPAQALWLDIGCGIGQHAIRLAKHGFRVTAAALSPGRVQRATSRYILLNNWNPVIRKIPCQLKLRARIIDRDVGRQYQRIALAFLPQAMNTAAISRNTPRVR